MNKLIKSTLAINALLFTLAVYASGPISWYMDWNKYGGVSDANAEKTTEAILNEVATLGNDGLKFKEVISNNLVRIFGENIRFMGKEAHIASGPFFNLAIPADDDINKYEITYLGKTCTTTPKTEISNTYSVSCTAVPRDFMTKLTGTNLKDINLKVVTEPISKDSHPFGQHFEYEEPVKYSSYAMEYWRDRGVNFDEYLGAGFTPFAYSSESALMVEKALFALGYFIKNKPEFDKRIPKNIETLNKAMNHTNADDLFAIGRSIECGKPAYEKDCPEIKGKPYGWLNIWDVRGEFSMRKIFEAKRDFFKQIANNIALKDDSRYQRIKQAEADAMAGKAIIYEEPMMIWGYQENKLKPVGVSQTVWKVPYEPAKQMNKVGRIWNFMMEPVVIKMKENKN